MVQRVGLGINVFTSKDSYSDKIQENLKEYCSNNRFHFHIEYGYENIRLTFIFKCSWYLSDIKVLLLTDVLDESFKSLRNILIALGFKSEDISPPILLSVNYLPNGYPSEW